MKTSTVTVDQLPKNVSFEYNCREPSKSSKAYKMMREQLKNAPEAFVELNTGIVLANDRYVLDGGHTILALMDALKEGEIDPKKVKVRVTFMDRLSPEEMAKRSVGLNTKVTPPLRGEKDIQGHWEVLKRNLDAKHEKLFEFKPNTNPGAQYLVDFLVAIIHGWSGHSPERCYAGKGVLVRLFTPEKYARFLPYLSLALEWWSFIYQELAKDSKVKSWDGVRKDRTVTLPDGTEFQGFVPEAYVWPLFTAFHQVILKALKEGWLVAETRKELEKRWTQKKRKMLTVLAGDYRDAGNSPTRMGKSSDTYLHQTVALLGE
jgi:hypothetical protein